MGSEVPGAYGSNTLPAWLLIAHRRVRASTRLEQRHKSRELLHFEGNLTSPHNGQQGQGK